MQGYSNSRVGVRDIIFLAQPRRRRGEPTGLWRINGRDVLEQDREKLSRINRGTMKLSEIDGIINTFTDETFVAVLRLV